jgi:hypothetical protein
MRLVLACARRGVKGLAVGLALSSLASLAGCPAPQSPKGPPPLYEDPPAPSWLDRLDGGAVRDGGGAGADGGGAGADW